MIERGQAKEDFNFYFQSGGGPCIDQREFGKVPIGGSIPVVQACFDICEECGCYYAVKVVRSDGTKTVQLTPPTPKLPQGAIRRTLKQFGPVANNPLMS